MITHKRGAHESLSFDGPAFVLYDLEEGDTLKQVEPRDYESELRELATKIFFDALSLAAHSHVTPPSSPCLQMAERIEAILIATDAVVQTTVPLSTKRPARMHVRMARDPENGVLLRGAWESMPQEVDLGQVVLDQAAQVGGMSSAFARCVVAAFAAQIQKGEACMPSFAVVDASASGATWCLEGDAALD